MSKLVRDRITDIIRAEGGAASVRVLDTVDFRATLLDKIAEEALEARSSSPAELMDELADVFKVARAVCASNGWTTAEVEEAADRKAETRGAFTCRLYLD